MLTSDLVRVRKRKGFLEPRYIDPAKKSYLKKAEDLISIYNAHVGCTRGKLEEAVRERISDGTDYLIMKGIAKLLTDRSEFEIISSIEPKVIRQKVFEIAAENYPVALRTDLYHQLDRVQVLEKAGNELGLAFEEVEQSFYADLQEAHILKSFDATDHKALLHRYNLGLAQAVLFRASALQIELRNASAKRLRQLLRYLKFFRLISSIHPLETGGYRFRIDGPLSLFRFSQKYGLQMASFLPALLLCEDWELEAEIFWEDKKESLTFKLDSESRLVSHYPDKGVYVTAEEKYFRKRWDASKLGWELNISSKIIRLGPKDIAVTDYCLAHPDGRKVDVEMVGFWHRQALTKKLEMLSNYKGKPLILAVPERLRVSQEKWPETAATLYFFKEVIHPKKLVALAEEIAV